MRTRNPLVSIIIVTRNRVQCLERALRSIFRAIEEYAATEVIVIDGASSDGTVELLKQYGPKLACWVSEPDSSVGEAVNKGLDRARGEIIHLTADDDEFLPHTIRFMARFLMEHPEVDAVSAEAEYLKEDADGSLVLLGWSPTKARRWTLGALLAQDDFGFPTGLWPEQQFTRRRLFAKSGGYDVRYKYFGYIDLFCRQLRSGAVFQHVEEVVLRRIFTPQSDIYNQPSRAVDRELSRIYRTYGGIAAFAKFWYLRKIKHRVTAHWYSFLKATTALRHPLRNRAKPTAS